MTDKRPSIPRIEALVMRNYRALRDLELKKAVSPHQNSSKSFKVFRDGLQAM